MSNVDPQKIIPGVQNWRRHVRNGKIPNAIFMRGVATRLAHVVGHRRKLLFSKSIDFANPNSDSGTKQWWFCRIPTGEAASRIIIHMLLLPAAADVGTSSPSVTWVDETNGVDVGTIQTPVFDPSTPDVPNGLIEAELTYDVDPATVYELRMDATGFARPLSVAIYEVVDSLDSDTDGVVLPAYSALQPILDEHHGDLLPAATALWRHNAPVLASWSRDTGAASAPTHTGDAFTWTNPFDGSTSVAETTAGFRLAAEHHNTYSEASVPVIFAIRAERVSGTAMVNARIADSSGEVGGLQIAPITSAGWYTAAGTVPADLTKVDLQVLNQDESTGVRVDAFTLYEWEA